MIERQGDEAKLLYGSSEKRPLLCGENSGCQFPEQQTPFILHQSFLTKLKGIFKILNRVIN